MSNYQLGEIINLLPKGNIININEDKVSAIRYRDENDDFVSPVLKMLNQPHGENSPIFCLIAAPGAVGKSTLANNIAYNTNSCVWDLASMRIGDGTFEGETSKAFGRKNLDSVMNTLGTTNCFIFDALDEAHILSGWPRLEEFIREMWQAVIENEKKPEKACFVLLARNETMEYISILLDELGEESEPYYLFEIDYFDIEKSYEFVKKYASKDTEVRERVQEHSTAFHQAFERVVEQIESSFNEDDQNSLAAKRFIGYAPVLQAIAKYLASHTNFTDVRDIQTQGYSLIKNLLFDLLEREKSKFINALKGRGDITVQGDWDDWSSLYTPEEQVMRMFGYLYPSKMQYQMPEGTPTEILNVYLEMVGTFLPEHPFLSNKKFAGPAFRDFVFAIVLQSSKYAATAESVLTRKNFSLTPLFHEFYVPQNKEVNGRHLGFVYESLLAKKEYKHRVVTVIQEEDDDETGENGIFFTISTDQGQKPNENQESDYKLRVLTDGSTPIVFNANLHNSKVDVPTALEFTGEFLEFKNVSIDAKELIIHGQEVSFLTYNSDDFIIMKSQEGLLCDVNITVSQKGNGLVAVNWPGADSYPWFSFYKDFEDSNDDKTQTTYALQCLSKILSPFRRDKRTDFGKHIDYIENVIVSNSKMRREMLEHLKEKGIISNSSVRREPLYIFNPERASEFGINYSMVRDSTTMSVEVASFLRDFLRQYNEKTRK